MITADFTDVVLLPERNRLKTLIRNHSSFFVENIVFVGGTGLCRLIGQTRLTNRWKKWFFC